VLLISIDTLRADRLGCYGYDRETSPVLDAFAEESVLFEETYATSCKTAESHMSLFTSLPVSAHGVSNASARLGLPVRELAKNRLTLVQVLRRAGYWNAAVVCGGNMIPQMGFSRGYEGRFESGLRDVSVIVDRTLAFLEAATTQPRPPFVFMHTYQVHGPYLPPAEYRERFAPSPRGVIGQRLGTLGGLSFEEAGLSVGTGFWDGEADFGPDDAATLSDLYDGEVAYTDHELGRLFEGLRQRDLLDRMIVVIFSDHGEEFAEHGAYQHDQLYTETLHVPLLIRLPGGRLGGTRVTGMTSLLDVMPTLLDLLGLEGPDTMTGRPLSAAMRAGATSDRPVLAERTMFPGAYLATLRSPDASAHFRAESRTLETHDLVADPGELSVLAPEDPTARAIGGLLHNSLQGVFALRAVLDAEDAGGSFTLDEEVRRELLELNYVGGDAAPEIPEGTPLDSWPEDAPLGGAADQAASGPR
jgi:arylsulfatase A-like enzyme